MRFNMRFSTSILSLVLLLLAAAAITLIAPAYLGSERALKREIRLGYERDQRVLNSLLQSQFIYIEQIVGEVSRIPSLRNALQQSDFKQVSHTIDQFLASNGGQQLDAVVAVDRAGQAYVGSSASLLNLSLPLEQLSERYVAPGVWSSLETRIGDAEYALLRLSLPVTSETDGEVVGVLHCFVMLNNSFWIINRLQQLFGSEAIFLLDGTTILDRLVYDPDLQMDDKNHTSLDQGLNMRGNTIVREHGFQLDQSKSYIVRSVLPNNAYRDLQSAYISHLSYALMLVAAMGILTMLAIRKLTRDSLSHLAQYAEQVPETGIPRPFSGAQFREFARVGSAVERMLMRIRERDKLLSSIVDNAPDVIFIKDLDRRYRLASKQFADALGIPVAKVLGARDEEVLSGEVLRRAQETDQRVIDCAQPMQFESVYGAGAEPKTFLVSKFPIFDDYGAITSIGCIAADITAMKKVQEALDLAHQVVAATKEAIIVLDEQQEILTANRAFHVMCGADEQGSRSVLARFMFSHPQVGDQLRGEDAWQGECTLTRADGVPLPVLVSISHLPYAEGRKRSAMLFSDISNIKQAERKLEQLALYDSLTGLPNRSQFYHRLDKQLAHSPRHTAVLFIDLDNFKVINDTHGHSRGDQLLRQVADRLRTCVQAKDTVARLGGDEFTVILADVSDRIQAETIAKRILHVLHEPYDLDSTHCFSSASIGIALGIESGQDPEILLNNADLAMYEAKMNGRNAVYFFDPDINARHQRRHLLEEGLREALARAQLFLQYQPRFDISAKQVLAAEALVRWHHPEHGVVPPGEFIPIAEESGLIVDIGRFVLHEACREAAALYRDGHELLISVNLSPRQLRDRDLLADIRNALSSYDLPARLLELEITETYVMENIDQFIPILTQIRDLGVGLAVDDFGTGYSSLIYLKKLPVNTVKIDHSFIHDIPGNVDDENLVRAIISMSHNLRLRVVAEGVESAEQLQFLRELHCDEIQGFLLGRPGSIDQLRRLSPPSLVAR
ncbi:EAL domain-containing protein [Marinobacterium sp. D7]|uniref:EAL domain-containing protein n=1 Tax=Marinobacterium ramblicola TaxID=2849041 RepID=UPI001C2DD1EB|nr:EAL domain-containing protein [Marinobacterium ramblicola]MBV1788062.1 EAL domain-containing protein [Marinobacterium ramblicola]